MKLYNGYKRLNENYTLLTDEYEYTMANTYLASGKENEEAIFDVFFRKIPNGGGYVIMAGLDKVIEYINNLKFGEREVNYFKRKGYNEEFIKYVTDFKFTGDIYAVPDGTPVFPNEPILTVKAPLNQAQIVETAILCMLNGAMEHATGARRIIEATPENVGVMEFGARRADGEGAAIDSSIYGIMAGCIGTSNVMAADMLNIGAIGTMAHSYIESFDTELEAFITYAKINPHNCMLLVDTYDTLKSGIPNAIRAFEYLRDNGLDVNHIGIRIDSGDLAYLSKEARKMLDGAGFSQAKICLSNGLNAETIESLVQQGAKFDVLGVGDNISKPDGRMGCVYKEVALSVDGELVPKIKVSEDAIKITNPGLKKLYRAYDRDTGYAIADIITLPFEKISKDNLLIISPIDYLNCKTIDNFELKELQKVIFKNGKLVYDDPDLFEKRDYCNSQMMTLYPEVKRIRMPHLYPVSGTENYVALKKKLVLEHKSKVK
jgi:nicotinate phosphoribosyltransferase